MVIELRIDERSPLQGEATVDGGAPRGFRGWLELLSLLSDILDEPGGPVSAPPGAGL